MEWVEVATQKELDAAVKAGNGAIVRRGLLRAYGSAQVTAYGSAQVTAYDSAQVTAYGSAQVTAYDSVQVTAHDSVQVTAHGSVQVRAYGSVQVRASDSVQVRASKYVAISDHGPHTQIIGGHVLTIPKPATVAEWCDFYDVPIVDGRAVLYKAVDDSYTSPHGMSYTPGTAPTAEDWDEGKAECGGGLHFCPRPFMAASFAEGITNPRFVACPVDIADIRPPTPGDRYPGKVKASRVASPIWEVDIDGNRI